MTRRAPDHAVRLRALDPQGSFILEAPAGSGKTDLLTARFLALLAEVASPRQILALTYTRKAANQMQSRILEVLRRARAGAAPGNDWDAFMLDAGRKALANERIAPETLRNPDAYRVGTFHSFCASVVRGWPLEACVPPGAGVLEDLEQASALETSVFELFSDIVSGKAPALRGAFERRLAAANNRPEALSGQIETLLKGRDRLDLFEKSMVGAAVDLSTHVENILEAYAAGILAPAASFFLSHTAEWKELKRTLEAGRAPNAANLPGDVPDPSLSAVPAWKEAAGVFLTKAGTPYRSLGVAGGFYKGFSATPSGEFVKNIPADVAAALATVRRWPDPGGDPADLVALADVLALVQAARKRLEARIPGTGLDYLELESAALRSLEWAQAPSESLVFFNEHLRHVLVDEAQDMNDVQVTILSRLCEGWEPGDGRTLFVVGDPKQSIYRFRRADVALFRELKERGLSRPGEPDYLLQPLELTANFRSDPGLVAFCNTLFERVMADPNPDYDEVAFQTSEAALPPSPDPVSIELALFHKNGAEDRPADDSPSPRELEAAYVAGRIAGLHANEPDASIALLFPARTALSAYLAALSALKVPLRLVEGEDLAARPEVRHLGNLLTALARPWDDVAWAGTLRAPWSHLPAAELLRLAGGRGTWRERILAESATDSAVAPLADSLSEALDAFGREPYEATLGALWENLGGPAATASYYGARGVANARAFLALLPACAGLPGEEALQKLDRILQKAYTPPDPRGAFSPVSVMTVHKAKGLEFDHVFAVNLDRNPGGGARGESPGLRMARMPGRDRPILMAAAPDARTGEKSLAFQVLEELDKKRELAEGRRLLYVAATRARKSLTLTGTASLTKKGLKAKHEASALGRLWSACLEEGDVAVAEPFRRLGLNCAGPNPAPPSPAVPVEPPPALGTPPAFDAEPLPYRVASPSEVEEETAQAAPFGAEEERDPHARARGIVAHRLFEVLARGCGLPPEGSVAAALATEGLPPAAASAEARPLMNETLSAWSLPDFLALRNDADAILPECALEDFDGKDRLRVGRLDLLVQRDGQFAIVDYKTGKPEGDFKTWIETHRKHYAPQLRAYAEMVARSRGVEPSAVTAYLLFTGPRVLVQV